MNNTEEIHNVKMSPAEQSIYFLFGTDPNTSDELSDESNAYQLCEFENHEQEAFEENHLNDDKLTRFAQLKLQAKAAGDKIEYAKLVEHEKLFKAENAASERQAKLKAREKERAEKEALRLQELAEVEAEKPSSSSPRKPSARLSSPSRHTWPNLPRTNPPQSWYTR